MQVLAGQLGEFSWIVLRDCKTQAVPIERNGLVDFVRNVSNGCHTSISSA
ncbi:hypothetical protein LG3211_5250 [Lysobacter gummosus]|nr:hypothetical protein LG3211_5250 [Lysobacter gummosus]